MGPSSSCQSARASRLTFVRPAVVSGSIVVNSTRSSSDRLRVLRRLPRSRTADHSGRSGTAMTKGTNGGNLSSKNFSTSELPRMSAGVHRLTSQLDDVVARLIARLSGFLGLAQLANFRLLHPEQLAILGPEPLRPKHCEKGSHDCRHADDELPTLRN